MGKTLRTGVIGALVAAVPVSSSYAATRPGAAVPMAASSSASAQDGYDGYDGGIAWIPIAIIAATILVAIWIAADDNDNDVEFSQG